MGLIRLSFIFIVSIIFFTEPISLKGKKKKNLSPVEKKLKNLKEEYRKTKCNYLGDDIVSQCFYYYISPFCF